MLILLGSESDTFEYMQQLYYQWCSYFNNTSEHFHVLNFKYIIYF